MDVRSYKMAHKVFPRISEFDSEMIKTMIQHSFRYQGSDDMIPCVQVRRIGVRRIGIVFRSHLIDFLQTQFDFAVVA